MAEYTENGDDAKRGEDDDDILREARERLEACWDYDSDNREQASIDLRFLAGDQWPESVRQERVNAGRPCLTLDHLSQHKNQVVNDIRQSKIALKAVADDTNTDDHMAEIYTSIMRDIQYKSHASHVYAMAAEGAVSCGIGHLRVIQDYIDDESFDQELLIKPLPYSLAVHWDAAALERDRSDAEYCFITEFVPEDTFERRWPKAKKVDVDAIADDPGSGITWSSTDGVLVAEYFRKVYDKRTITSPDGLQSREVKVCKIEHMLITGSEILEGPTVIAGKYIPVVAVIGTEVHLEKKRVRAGLVRAARDAQQLYNYWRSAAAELIALAPKAKWLATAKQIQSRQAEWDSAHSSPKPYLLFTADDKAGGPPQLISPPAPPNAIWQEAALVVDDMKAATGIYDAALGAKSNETSGVAIARRQGEGDVSTFHFSDNLQRSLEHLGCILIDLIPIVYDTSRHVRLMDENDAHSFQPVNLPLYLNDGQQVVHNDLSKGKYAIRVTIGPSFTTQRIEAASAMLEYVKADPEALPMMRDLFIKNQDWPGAEAISERFKKAIPQQILGPEEIDPNAPPPPAPPPDPQVVAMQQKLELEKQKAQAEGEREQQKLALEAKRAEQEIEIEKAKFQLEQEVAFKKLELERQKALGSLVAERDKHKRTMDLEKEKHEGGMDFERDKLMLPKRADVEKVMLDKVAEIMAQAQEMTHKTIAENAQATQQAVVQNNQDLANALRGFSSEVAQAIAGVQASMPQPVPHDDGPQLETNRQFARAVENIAKGLEKLAGLSDEMVKATKAASRPRKIELTRDKFGNAVGASSRYDDDE